MVKPPYVEGGAIYGDFNAIHSRSIGILKLIKIQSNTVNYARCRYDLPLWHNS